MRSRFGFDFSAIRVHTDSASAQMCKEVGAKAFAVGNCIYYGSIEEKRYNYKAGKEKDWNYMSTEARFRCVASSTDRDLKENEVHLGHELGKGTSQHWDGRISGEKPGHTQTKKQNQVWNKNPDNYRGPEHSHYSSRSGREAEEYVIPGPHLDPPSHPRWWDSDHPDYVKVT